MSGIFRKQTGFTIVELLIVIVVIGILAAITIVAYNGIQDRATYTKARADLSSIRKALELYHIENQEYPDSSLCENTPGHTHHEYNWCGWDQGQGDSFIPGLSPEYIAALPTLSDSLPKRISYLYQSGKPDGTGEGGTYQYQLIRFHDTSYGGGLSKAEKTNNPDILVGGPGGYTGNEAWGYKSHPETPWW